MYVYNVYVCVCIFYPLYVCVYMYLITDDLVQSQSLACVYDLLELPSSDITHSNVSDLATLD